MRLYLCSLIGGGVLKRFADIESRQRVLSLQVENPSVGIEKRGVLGLLADGLLAHLLRFAQITA